jgi:5-oxoprolinase (ATP-hydrolysing) subunit A
LEAVKIDINCDMGEGFGAYKIGEDEKMIRYVTSANIACGFHAGDPMVMARTLQLAKSNRVAVGAHPGYPDLIGFGRRALETSPGEIKNYVLYQIGAIAALARASGLELQHVKPHGALYNHAAKNERAAVEITEAVKSFDPDLVLFVLAGSMFVEIARAAGLRVVQEAFADRAYTRDGQLAPRKLPGAVIHDRQKVRERVLKLVKTGIMVSIEGDDISLNADTLCLHGDTPGAWELAKTIREALDGAGIRVVAVGRK